MEKYQKDFVETYQCPGCVVGSGIECFGTGEGIECGKHVCGTLISNAGHIFLGMPTGFSRLGPAKTMKIHGFTKLSDGWGFSKFNVPVWKFKDEHGNTLVRGISPRINSPFLHIFLGDHLSEIDCLEITREDVEFMD